MHTVTESTSKRRKTADSSRQDMTDRNSQQEQEAVNLPQKDSNPLRKKKETSKTGPYARMLRPHVAGGFGPAEEWQSGSTGCVAENGAGNGGRWAEKKW